MSASRLQVKSQVQAVLWFSLCCLVGAVTSGCGTEEPTGVDTFPSSVEAAASELGGRVLDVTREQVTGEVSHYSFLIKVGHTPHAQLRIHRVTREAAPGWPRPARQAVMLLHGDFATFTSNFLPSLTGTA